MLGLRAFSGPTGALRSLEATTVWTAHRYVHSTSRLFYLKKYHQNFDEVSSDSKVNSKLLLSSLKDLQAFRGLKTAGNKSAVPLLKDAHRSISQLVITGKKENSEVSLKELETVVGPKTAIVWRLIMDLVQTGESSTLSALSEEERAKILFTRVHAIGPKYAEAFVAAGARKLEDISKAKDKELGRKVSDAQRLGIEHFEDMETFIPRAEVDQIRERFAEILQRVDKRFHYEVMGSYRRGEALSSDVDIVVYHPSYKTKYGDAEVVKAQDKIGEELMEKLLAQLYKEEFLYETKVFSKGAKKFIALTRLDKKGTWRQVDIRLCPKESVPYMLVGNTGDSQLMKLLRLKAKIKGLILNEYTMAKAVRDDSGLKTAAFVEDSYVSVKNEEEIFKKLGLPYLEPQNRSFRHYKNIPTYASRLKLSQEE